jgi:hypothetical protein
VREQESESDRAKREIVHRVVGLLLGGVRVVKCQVDALLVVVCSRHVNGTDEFEIKVSGHRAPPGREQTGQGALLTSVHQC